MQQSELQPSGSSGEVRVCDASRRSCGGHFACLRLPTVRCPVRTFRDVGTRLACFWWICLRACIFLKCSAKLRKNPETTMDLLIFSGHLESFFFFGTDFTNLHEFFLKTTLNNLDRSSSARLQGKNFFCVLNVVPVVLVVFHSLPAERA